MKRILKVLGAVFGLAALGMGGFAAKVQATGIPHYPVEQVTFSAAPTPERIANGRKWASMLCADCHGNLATGRLTGADMKLDAQFGRIYSLNITQHPTAGIGAWTDAELAYLLRTGIARDGRYTPPWMAKLPHLSDEDLASVIAFLRSDDPMVAASDVPNQVGAPNFFSKFLAHVAFKPLPYPKGPIAAPPTTDAVAYGRYLAWNLDCYTCHSADFATIDSMEPPKTKGYFGGGNDVDGILSTNLTPDPEHGIGTWSEDDFVRALREGVRPDHTAIRYPMNAYAQLTVDEAKALFAYLKTVPPLANAVKRTPAPPVTPEMAAGQKAYVKYACTSCHGETGTGNCDLTKNKAHHPTDEALTAFIRDPASVTPGSRMPAWKSVIPDAELKDLVTHVRTLSK